MTQIPPCPVLYPTTEQFSNFSRYTEYLQETYKHLYGMVKIVPPKSWISKAQNYQQRLQNLNVKHPIEQNLQGSGGYYESKNIIQNRMTFNAYKKYALEQQKIIINKTANQKQRLFWKTLTYSPPVYGADLTGSLIDAQAGAWDLNNLDSILRYALPNGIKGVTEPYCYIGSWKAFFSWHKEDLDLSALNFIHEGQSKIWYSIVAEDGIRLEKQAKSHFKLAAQKCPEFLRHKTFLINPSILMEKQKGIRISKVEHKAGEIMLVFGGAYHCGFNCGFNIAEAVNYGTLSWLKRLTEVSYCQCSRKSVKAQIESILFNLQESAMYESLSKIEQYQSLQVYVHYLQQLEGVIPIPDLEQVVKQPTSRESYQKKQNHHDNKVPQKLSKAIQKQQKPHSKPKLPKNKPISIKSRRSQTAPKRHKVGVQAILQQ